LKSRYSNANITTSYIVKKTYGDEIWISTNACYNHWHCLSTACVIYVPCNFKINWILLENTIGYIFSLLFDTIEFFQSYSWIKHCFAVNYNTSNALVMYQRQIYIYNCKNGATTKDWAFTFLNPALHILIILYLLTPIQIFNLWK